MHTDTHTRLDQLKALLSGPSTLAAVAAHLENLPVSERVRQVQDLHSAQLEALWDVARAASPLTVGDVVPSNRAPFMPVRWLGRNSLPAVSLEERRFYRDQHGRVWGHHNQPIRALEMLVGPGYFAVTAHPENPEQVQVDYTKLPDTAPPGWPAITANDRGLSFFIFGNQHDALRRVCDGVVIGKGGKVDQLVALVRVED